MLFSYICNMGVTLHYKGQLKSPDVIDDITRELIDISEAREWKYQIIRSAKEDGRERGEEDDYQNDE